jgi:hypothetical protein
VQTDRSIPKTKPDAIISDNVKGKNSYILIDVAISGDKNVFMKEVERILKYRNLTIEIQRV